MSSREPIYRSEENNINFKNKAKKIKLSQLKKEEEALIKHIPEHSLLPPLNLRKGKVIKVKSRQKFNGPIVCQVEGRSIALARRLTDEIRVEVF